MKKFNKVLLIVSAIIFVFGLTGFITVFASTVTAPDLGTSANFSALAKTSMDCTHAGAHCMVSGNYGLSHGTSADAIGNWQLQNSLTTSGYFSDSSNPTVSSTAMTNASSAYDNMANHQPNNGDGGWSTAGSSWSPDPGVWTVTGNKDYTGTLHLDAKGDYNAVWIIRVEGNMTFNGQVSLENGAQACHLFWQVAGTANIISGGFVGTLIASKDIDFSSGGVANSRVISLNGSLSMDGSATNQIYGPTCYSGLTLNKIVAHGQSLLTDWTLSATGTGTGICTSSDPSYLLCSVGWDQTPAGCSSQHYSCNYTGPTNLIGTTPVNQDSDPYWWGIGFLADIYTLAESGPSGYTTSPWFCVGGTQQDDSTIKIDPGEGAVCTITNADTPLLTLKDTVVNNNGGTAAVTDWTLTASKTFSFINISGVTGDSAITNAPVATGTYDLSESAIGGFGGYTASAWSCTNNIIVNDAGEITLSDGQSTVCTITNNDIAPKLHLLSVIDKSNGGTAAVTDWTLTANGTLASPTNLSDSTPVNSSSNFKADTYALSESGPDKYSSSWNCVDAEDPNSSIALGSDSSITLALGEELTCTVTNTYSPPKGCTGSCCNGGCGSYAKPFIKVAKVPSPLSLPTGPGLVTYTYTLHNTGTIPVIKITMADDSCSPLKYISGDANNDSKLDTTETWIYTCQTKLDKTTTNTVVASGESIIGAVSKDSATVTVVVTPTPIVPKLPKTGFPPQGESIPWNIIIVVSSLTLISTFLVILRKNKI